MIKPILICLFVSLAASPAQAEARTRTALSRGRLQALVAEFQVAGLLRDPRPNGECQPQPDALQCIRYMSERAYQRDAESLKAFGLACRGNFGSACVQYISERTYQRDVESLKSFAKACAGNADESCVRYMSERTYQRDAEALKAFAVSCAGNDQ
jgi:hypothetical protein